MTIISFYSKTIKLLLIGCKDLLVPTGACHHPKITLSLSMYSAFIKLPKNAFSAMFITLHLPLGRVQNHLEYLFQQETIMLIVFAYLHAFGSPDTNQLLLQLVKIHFHSFSESQPHSSAFVYYWHTQYS